tara:strand:- start:726 stop:953 length:228 start_codon:yes stop_codon:yes gene_type:complete
MGMAPMSDRLERLKAINQALSLAEQSRENPTRMLTILATAAIMVCEGHGIPIEEFLQHVMRGHREKTKIRDEDSE